MTQEQIIDKVNEIITTLNQIALHQIEKLPTNQENGIIKIPRSQIKKMLLTKYLMWGKEMKYEDCPKELKDWLVTEWNKACAELLNVNYRFNYCGNEDGSVHLEIMREVKYGWIIKYNKSW